MSDDPPGNGDDSQPKPKPKPAAREATAAETPQRKIGGAFVDAAVKIIAAFATTAGFLAFVAATGTAITWVQLASADLPAELSLRVIPKADFILTGQIALTLFVILGVVAVAAVYAIDPERRVTDGMRAGLQTLVTAELVLAVLLVDDLSTLRRWLAVVVCVIPGILAVLVACLTPSTPEPPPTGVRGWLMERKFAKYRRITEAEAAQHDAARRERVEYQRLLTARGIALMLLGVAATTVALLLILTWDAWWAILAPFVATALAGVCLKVGQYTRTFWPYALAVFFSVILFGAMLQVARMWSQPHVEPAALIRQGNDGVTGVVGLFIAKTDDRYWLAAQTVICDKDKPVAVKSGSGRLFSIPISQVLDESVGAAGPAIEHFAFGTAGDRALDLLQELVQRQPPGGAPAPPAPTPTGTATATATPTATATATATPPATEDLRAEDAARVPRALAMTGDCMRLPARPIRLEPTKAAPGDVVQIIGTDLGPEAGKVTLNGENADASGWTAQRVTFTVPSNAHSGQVRVVTRERTSNGLVLTIAPNAVPVAGFSARRLGKRSKRFALDASTSVDPEDGELTYHWSSPIGTFDSSQSSTPIYRLPDGQASSAVTLTVTDDHQQPSSAATQKVRGSIVDVFPEAGTFFFGKARLTSKGQRHLARLRRQIRPLRSSIATVTIYGYTDFVGTDAFNQDLSERRARVVRRGLFPTLPRAGKITVKGFGKTQAKAKTLADPRRAYDRRVEVTVTTRR